MPSLSLPPCDLAAEQAVLGALIADNWLYGNLRFLSPDDFCDSVHGEIYAAIVRRVEAGLPADAQALREEFIGQLAEVGGPAYIGQLVLDEDDPLEQAEIIHALSQRRSGS